MTPNEGQQAMMTLREVQEYTTLRDAIRERGTARVWIFVVGLIGWGGLTIATAALAALPVATLLPLLVLGGVFEAVFSLHTGVERIGRYIQVFFEDTGGWEHVAMAYGRAHPGAGPDPLFTTLFIVAVVLNFVPVLTAEPVAIEVEVFGAAHVVLVGRILLGRRAAGRQRAVDLERYKNLKREGQRAEG